MWNTFLDQQEQIYTISRMVDAKPPPITFENLGVAFTQLRKNTSWLQELPFAVVRYTLKYQADAWKSYFRKQGGHPKFKGRHGDDGFTIPDRVRIHNGRIYITKLGWYVLRRRGGNPHPDGIPKIARIKQCNGKWYCTVSYEVDIETPVDDGLAIGVDRNVGQVATSTGDIIHLPEKLKMLEARKRRYQRMMARRKKGSNRRGKARHLMAKTSRKIAQVRKDWNHQTTRILANTASEIILEDLHTSGMTKSAKGTVEKPGKNVRQKAGLNREILNTGWHQLEQMLEYKSHTLTFVPAPYTSQACHECGSIDSASRLSQSEFKCTQCGFTSNADVNAALNILALGIEASGREGALALATPLIRQKVMDEAA